MPLRHVCKLTYIFNLMSGISTNFSVFLFFSFLQFTDFNMHAERNYNNSHELCFFSAECIGQNFPLAFELITLNNMQLNTQITIL